MLNLVEGHTLMLEDEPPPKNEEGEEGGVLKM